MVAAEALAKRGVLGEDGEPAAKRQRSEPKNGEDLSDATRGAIMEAIVALLAEDKDGQGFMMGSLISKGLNDNMELKALADETKAAYGGKGWLVRLLEPEPAVNRVQIEGRDEPCFQLADGFAPPGSAPRQIRAPVPSQKKERTGESREDRRERKPKGEGASKPKAPADVISVLPQAETPVPLPVDLHEPAATLVRRVTEAMNDEPYMEGNKIVKVLMDEFPDEAAKVRSALDNKGWLKKLLSGEPAIEQVVVAGRDEPCYRLAGVGVEVPICENPIALQMQRQAKPSSGKAGGGGGRQVVGGKGGGCKGFSGGKGMDMFGGGMPGMPDMMTMMAKAMWMKGMGKGPAKGMGGGMGDMMTSFMMGKGMAAGGFGADMVKGGGKKGKGGGMSAQGGESRKRERRDRDTSSMKEINPQKVEAVAMSRATLCQSAVEVLQGLMQSGETTEGWVEGNKLRMKLADLHPTEINEVKSAYDGKGWLKKMFADEQSIEEGRAPGRDEPCYRLAALA